MIIDSHCHLDYEPLSNNLDEVVDRAKKNGVKYFLTISTTNKSFSKILEIIKKYPSIYGSYGIHPHESGLNININSSYIVEKTKLSKKIIGIGETGLDFYYNHSPKDKQKKLFIEHINAAQETGLPLIVHTRSAENDTYDILHSELKNKKFKVLIHCFTGSKGFAEKLLNLNCYISASGIVTFKNSSELASTFKQIPNEKILVETDSPYLSPDPLRGRSNEPSNIIHTVKFLSNLKKISEKELSEITSRNFFDLFGNLN